MLEARAVEEHCLLAWFLWFVYVFYTVQLHMLRGTTEPGQSDQVSLPMQSPSDNCGLW